MKRWCWLLPFVLGSSAAAASAHQFHGLGLAPGASDCLVDSISGDGSVLVGECRPSDGSLVAGGCDDSAGVQATTAHMGHYEPWVAPEVSASGDCLAAVVSLALLARQCKPASPSASA